MNPEETSQLLVYERSITRLSNSGNRKGVVFLGGLICQIAEEKRESAVSRLSDITSKSCLTEEEMDNVAFLGGEVETYNKWIGHYSRDSFWYNKLLEEAESNSWRRDDYSSSD